MHLSGRRNNVTLMQNDKLIQEPESTAAGVEREAMKPTFLEGRFCQGRPWTGIDAHGWWGEVG